MNTEQLLLLDQDHGMRDRGVVGTHAFRSLCFHAYIGGLHFQKFGNAFLNARRVRADLRSSEDYRSVAIHHAIPGTLDVAHCFFKEDDGVCALPLWVARRKERSDVARSNGT